MPRLPSLPEVIEIAGHKFTRTRESRYVNGVSKVVPMPEWVDEHNFGELTRNQKGKWNCQATPLQTMYGCQSWHDTPVEAYLANLLTQKEQRCRVHEQDMAKLDARIAAVEAQKESLEKEWLRGREKLVARIDEANLLAEKDGTYVLEG